MRIDLKKVNAEITGLRSKLAAIDNELDECRRRHVEHPLAWSHIRRGLTFERHRVLRRLDEFTFARRCAGGRPLGLVAMLSFRSLASLLSEQDTESDRMRRSHLNDRPVLELARQPEDSLDRLRVNSPVSSTVELPEQVPLGALPDQPALRVIQGGRV